MGGYRDFFRELDTSTALRMYLFIPSTNLMTVSISIYPGEVCFGECLIFDL